MAKNIIVCQTGARHRYLIPQVLEDAGLLYRLYTDSTAYSFLGKTARFLTRTGVKPTVLQRLCNRLPKVDNSKLHTTDKPLWSNLLTFKKSNEKKIHTLYQGFSKKCISWGVGNADCVYSMFIENFDFLKFAKSKGLKIVVDIYEMPWTCQMMINEISINKEYEVFKNALPNYTDNHAIRMKYLDDVLSLADYYTVPSSFVMDSLQKSQAFDKNKALFLPYASSITPKQYDYHPVKHRLIWVGNDPVRKGLLYCAKAATKLKKTYPDLDFRIVGVVPSQIINHSTFKDLHFLGVLDKEHLIQEYSSAEAYVFPTLSEGFAGTIIEAASCGCPIITTDSAGTDTNSFPAIYIPTRDVNSIVENVSTIFEDSKKRDALSEETFSYAQSFDPQIYKNKLVDYLSKV